ncbi:hypothetical protein FRB91_001615 [Serendipita sp. 411]|nr:hypothetical protein FRC19_006658 [Serendipita sp. 401]KAG8837881.1 hypothetical protein FRC18_007464 [Serendipita sp. 400]KAG8855891.1 hypothetical protein FRB91_001615 [Serendipita sp. 411]KAG8869074.1 hypothetical protein FRC20_002223 [Serendipita sp. 405]
MKRPAMEETGSTTPRTRRRLAIQLSSKTLSEVLPAPHPRMVTDDERQPPIVYGLHENFNNKETYSSRLLDREHSSQAQENGIIKPPSPTSVDEDNTDSTRSSNVPRRPLPRLKIKPLRQPSPPSDHDMEDLALISPIPSYIRPPPCTPTEGNEEHEDRLQQPLLLLNTAQSGKLIPSVDLSRLPPSPVSITQLFEPEHHPPTPPYFVKDLVDPNIKPYNADSEALAESLPNANTYLRKGRFQKSKKGKKSNNGWSFRECEAFPRGETPPLETYLDEVIGPLDLIAMGLAAKGAPPSGEPEESETFTDEEEAEIFRDPGLPLSLAVGIDEKGRYVCKWGGCDKTFARNDHLGRHVKVTHLRVRKHRCEPCGLAFVGIKGLRSHEKTHVVTKMKSDTEEPVELPPSAPISNPITHDADAENDSQSEPPDEEDDAMSIPDLPTGPKLEPETEGDD